LGGGGSQSIVGVLLIITASHSCILRRAIAAMMNKADYID